MPRPDPSPSGSYRSWPIRPTLIVLGLFSPVANVIASSMLLFPDPLAPASDIRPGWKSMTVFLYPNDLNPNISTLRM